MVEPSLDGALRFCDSRSPKPVFCADFDAPPLLSAWSDPLLTGNGLIDVDPTVATSPPNSFVATTPAFDAGGLARARLCTSFAGVPAEMHLAFDVRADYLLGATSTAIGSLRLENGAVDTYYVNLETSEARFILVQRSAFDGGLSLAADASTIAPIEFAAWIPIRMDVSLTSGGSGTNGGVTVRVGNDASAAQPLSTPLIYRSIELCLGLVAVAAPSDGARVHYDSVTLDMK
jgi:hypothetical protein